MNKLFEQRMQKLLQNDYPAFESALNQKPIKSFYLNPLKHGSILCFAGFGFFRHKSNIGRLIHGTENKLGAKKE